MLKIGDFSKLSRISIRMLRHYDQIGLLIPASTDPFTGYRYYSETQLPVAGRIAALKDMGFGLTAIAELLKNYHDPEALKQYLEIKQLEVQEQAEEAKRRLQLLDTAIRRLGKDELMMNYDVTKKIMPKRYVASVRMVIPAYHQEHILWNTLYKETAAMNLQEEEPCCGLALFHDEGFSDGEVDAEIQLQVKGTYKDTEHVKFKTVDAFEIASATYQGSYEKITEVNEAVAKWLCDNGYEISGPSFCIYHVSPAQTQNPEELVTEVCYPIKQK